jgi:putative spermidine/putrescine transport system permease protein
MQLAAKTTTVTDPEIYALGSATTAGSVMLIIMMFTLVGVMQRRRRLK